MDKIINNRSFVSVNKNDFLFELSGGNLENPPKIFIDDSSNCIYEFKYRGINGDPYTRKNFI